MTKLLKRNGKTKDKGVKRLGWDTLYVERLSYLKQWFHIKIVANCIVKK